MSGLTSMAGLGALENSAGAAADPARDYYEVRVYHVELEAQGAALGAFLADAAIPALNRIAVSPVGVFQPAEDVSPLYVLLRHPSAASVATATQRLLADDAFLADGAAVLDAPSSSPAYTRVESSLLVAFTGMPRLARPSTAAGRVFQLRIYESPSIKTGQKKIEMFNTAELDIFRKTGLNAVFFGETLVGAKMPNLTYMLGFDSMEEQEAAWDRFRGDADWKKLSAMPEYANEAILCGITNLSLKPLACSQI